MRWTSIIAIYSLFWVMSAFFILPFGVRTHEEAGIARVPGQSDSAPAEFNARRTVKRATLLSIILFGLFYANYVEGWVDLDTINLFGKAPIYGEPTGD